MGTEQLADLIAGGPAMLGASRSGDLVPEAFRVWGASIVDPERLRVLVSSDAERSHRDLGDEAPIAVTFTDIHTFRSIQAKGVVDGPVEAPGPGDVPMIRSYEGAFGAGLAEVGHPPSLLDSIRPVALFAVTMRVTALYDQTPGAGAGAALAPSAP